MRSSNCFRPPRFDQKRGVTLTLRSPHAPSRWRARISAAIIFLATSAALLLFKGMRVTEAMP